MLNEESVNTKETTIIYKSKKNLKKDLYLVCENGANLIKPLSSGSDKMSFRNKRKILIIPIGND